MKSKAWRVLILASLIVCSACSSNKDDGAAPADTAAVKQASQVRSSQEAIAVQTNNLGKLIDVIVGEAADLPRAEFEPAALAESLGKDPEAHFEWVRDHTWWAPYRGLLRGSKGVMLDRVGSSLDRAVLLGDLLRHAGYKVRLAHAELPDNLARELLAKVPPIPDQRTRAIGLKAKSPERQRTMEAIQPGFEKSMQEQVADSKRRVSDAELLARSQADLLHAAVRDAVVSDSSSDREAIAALKDHWWVEREEPGKWIAMDVLLPDGKMGNAAVVTDRTSAWERNAAFPSVPASDWQSVEIQVVVERYESGTTNESTLLKTELRPAEVIDRPIMLVHLPKPWPEDLPDARTAPNALGEAAVNVKEWVPFLKIGDEYITQSGFSEGGDIIAAPFNSQRDISALGGGGGFMSGFGEALGGGETPQSSLTAEWIDYEIRVPGKPGERLRRPVFDVLGPVNRAAKTEGFDSSTNDRLVERYEALLSRIEILLQPCSFTAEYVAYRATASMVANQADIRKLSQERDPARAKDLATTILGRLDSWSPLPDLAFWRSVLNSAPGGWFIDRPNVLNHRATRPVVNGDQAALRETIDIASNSIGVRPSVGKDVFGVRLRQGVADTVAEMLVLGGEAGRSENTASIFAAESAEPGYGRLIGKRDAESVQNLGWPEDVSARLASTIDSGFIAVAVNQPVEILGRQRVGWWRIDPASGETIGVMDTGLHEETGDYSLTLLQVSFLRAYLVAYAVPIAAARAAPVLTAGQSLLLRAAQAAENAIALASRPFF